MRFLSNIILVIIVLLGCDTTPESKKQTGPVEKPVSNDVDPRALEFNNKIFELQPFLFPDRIDSALVLLDSAIAIDHDFQTPKFNKLSLLMISDSVKGKAYFLEVEKDSSMVGSDPFYFGILNEYYGLYEKSERLYQLQVEKLLRIKTDTMNNIEEIHYLDNLIMAYLGTNEIQKADSVLDIIKNEFTSEFKQSSVFYNQKTLSREEVIGEMIGGFKPMEMSGYDLNDQSIDSLVYILEESAIGDQ